MLDLDFDPKTARDDEMACPYCGYRIRDSWEYKRDEGKAYCEGCGKDFRYTRYIDITFRTMTIPEGEEKP